MPSINLNWGELAYDRMGAGAPVVLFIHGFSCSSQDWRLQMADLEKGATCIALDLCAHGRSAPAPQKLTMASFASDALALLQALDIEAAVLVGHSMGTRIALEAALQSPDSVAGLVLIDGSKVEASPEDVRAAIARAIDQEGFEGWSRRNMSEMFLDGLSPADQELILQRATDLGAELGLDLYESMTAWDQTRLSIARDTLSVPVSVVQSTSILPGEERQRCFVSDAPSSPWLDGWRDQGKAQIITLAETGHFAMLERPAAVNTVIRDMLQQI